jgi:hypothetical protein
VETAATHETEEAPLLHVVAECVEPTFSVDNCRMQRAGRDCAKRNEHGSLGALHVVRLFDP